jgi:hypothetical protein
MSEGRIDTIIRTQIEAVKGSPICKEEPDTKFVKKSYAAMIYEDVTVPKGWHLERSH